MSLKFATLKHGSRAAASRDPEKVYDQLCKQAAQRKLNGLDLVIDLDEPNAPIVTDQVTEAEQIADWKDYLDSEDLSEDICYDQSCDYVSRRALLGLPEAESRGRRMAFYESGDDEVAYFGELGMTIKTHP